MILALTLSLSFMGTAQASEVSVTEKGHASNPAWSQDGTHLAFEVNDYGGNISMYVVKVANGNPTGTPSKVKLPGGGSQFGGGGSVVAAPSWHPDGMLIFEGSTSGGKNRLYFWQPGGAAASELLSISQVAGDLSWPTVSPNGMSVAFVSDSSGAGDIFAWDRQTNAVNKLATSPFSEMAPRYKSDGETLAYSRKNQGGEDIFMMASGQSVPRVGGNGDQTRPVWAGEMVAFFTNERGDEHWDIGVSNGPGAKVVVARDVRLPTRAAPAISPDGGWVAYGFNNPEMADKIGVVKSDGTGAKAFDTGGLVAVGEPAIVEAAGRVYLAFTALPSEGSDWRSLHILDITGKL